MARDIFPDTFNNYNNPSSPWVSIQFRTKVSNNESVKSPGLWEDITIPPSNFFKNLTVEDIGGVKKFTLNLVDKNFVTLERILTKTMLATKLSNDLAKKESGGVNANIENETLDWKFKINNFSSANIRIRFGYSEMSQRDATDFGPEFDRRVDSDQPVVRTPWIYLMIKNFNRTYDESGLNISIEGFSVTTVFLDTVKVLKRGMSLVAGSPEYVIDYLGKMISNASGGKMTVEIENRKDLRDAVVSQNGERAFVINLGSEINESKIEYRTLRSVFQEIIRIVPGKVYDLDNVEQPLDPTGAEAIRLSNADNVIPYAYSVKEEEDGSTKILFYYPDPYASQQSLIRNYIWREYGQSIVKNVSIDSPFDFATLNNQVVIVDQSGAGTPPRVLMAASRVNADGREEDSHLGSVEEVTEAINSAEFGNAFVMEGRTLGGQNELTDVAARIMTRVVHDLNRLPFNGTIELIGDPFFLFDGVIRPAQYLIKILLLKPAYVDESGKYIGPELSNISGRYLVLKITHIVNSTDGFNTTLGVQRLIERGAPPVPETAAPPPQRRIDPPPAAPDPNAPPQPPPGPVELPPEEILRRRKKSMLLRLRTWERAIRRDSVEHHRTDPDRALEEFHQANELLALSEELEMTELDMLDEFISRLSSINRERAGL